MTVEYHENDPKACHIPCASLEPNELCPVCNRKAVGHTNYPRHKRIKQAGNKEPDSLWTRPITYGRPARDILIEEAKGSTDRPREAVPVPTWYAQLPVWEGKKPEREMFFRHKTINRIMVGVFKEGNAITYQSLAVLVYLAGDLDGSEPVKLVRFPLGVFLGLYEPQAELFPEAQPEPPAVHIPATSIPQVTEVPPAAPAAPSPEGRKDDSGKDRWDLLPLKPLAEVVRVLTFGAKKYGPNNWQQVKEARIRYQAAAFRHLFSYANRENNDRESGLPHLAHAVCCLLFLLHFDGVDSSDTPDPLDWCDAVDLTNTKNKQGQWVWAARGLRAHSWAYEAEGNKPETALNHLRARILNEQFKGKFPDQGEKKKP